MIAARKLPPFNFVLRRWLTRVLRRRFHNVYLHGAENLRRLAPGRPVVGAVNHTNWWDGFVLYVLSHRCLPHDIYLVMEEANLRRYRFFTWMGVFGVDLSGPRAALPGLRYAMELLAAAAVRPRLVWVFVQGKLVDPRRPVEVKAGGPFLAHHTGAQILPLVLRYEWRLESHPGIFVRIGEPLPPDTSADDLAAVLNGLLASHDAAMGAEGLDCGRPLFGEKMSMNKRWDYFVRLVLRRRDPFDTQNR